MNELPDDGREERGRQIAAAGRIKQSGNVYLVPSQSSGGTYVVDLAAEDGPTCNCPDFELRRQRCKHVHSVEFFIIRQIDDVGIVTETRGVRVTYSQNWPRYNRAQMNERDHVEQLLRALCSGIVTPPQMGRGQRRHQIADLVFAAVMKVYGTMSARRSASDLRACESRGSVEKAPHYNSVLRCLENPEMTPLLKTLVEESAAPLAAIETRFAVDSTGFGTATYRRWYDAKYGREMREQEWVKAHAMIGTLTNVITAVNVTDGYTGDSPEMPGLIAATARHFTIAEVSGDKAYLSHANLAAVEAVGGVPYVPFKSNSQGDGSAAWRRMWGLFMYRQAEFLEHYHARSNVESTFSAVKRKFGGAVRSKTFPAQVNEVLCKLLCFNITVLVHAMHELGIQHPSFSAPKDAMVT